MRPPKSLVMTMVGILTAHGVASAADRKATTVADRAGRIIETLRRDGTIESTGRPDRAGVASARQEPPRECNPNPTADAQVQVRSIQHEGLAVDACGHVRRAGNVPGAVARQPGPRVSGTASTAPQLTIDRMTTRGAYYSITYNPGDALRLLGSADQYFLSDGTSWSSGAGTYYLYSTRLDHVEVSGSVIRYVLAPPPSYLYQQTDFDSGEHSSVGTLGAVGTLTLEAVAGSATAVMTGTASIVANEAAYYDDPRFNYFSSIVGSVVPFTQTYTLLDGQTWAPDTFTRSFNYNNVGEVDFLHPLSVPTAVELKITGPPRIPDQRAIQFKATVRYENDVVREATSQATWDVDPSGVATIQGGRLAVSALPVAEAILNLHASYDERGAHLSALKSTVCVRGLTPSSPGVWPMYQADARHTGHLPLYLRPDQAALRWQRAIGSGLPLNPVAAGDGKVLVSLRTYFQDIPTLFSVDAATGQTLWSKAFGDVFSVNPPSYAYGMVYLQTGQDGSPPFLHAFDATTGEEVFEETFEAQWERYYAPTVEDGKVYIDGGYYGGMYRFDAFSGEPDWFLGVLPQYDQWTPAISQGLAYSYVGEYEPGLYVADAADGGLVAYIPDPQFQWDGWSMNEAPVVAGGRDVLAVHDGRLILFDTGNRSIRWQKERNFTGQPSVARHAVYAVDAGHLAVLDKETGADLWSWQPPEGALIGRMIVTDSHVLASTAANVYAIDVRTRQSVWSYPAGGDLALAEGTLYVASSSGLLTAITMPDVAPSALISLEITGPSPVVENSSATFHALAHYGDGSVADRTLVSSWSIEPATYADIGAGGVMTTRELLQPSQDAVVRARYMENGQTIEGMLTVRLVVGVSIPEFVRRSLTESVAIKRQLVHALDEALTRERAALAAASPPPGGSQLPEAIAREEAARAEIRATIALLRAALATLGPP